MPESRFRAQALGGNAKNVDVVHIDWTRPKTVRTGDVLIGVRNIGQYKNGSLMEVTGISEKGASVR